MNPSDFAQALAEIRDASRGFEELAGAENWADGHTVHQKRHSLIAKLLASELNPEQQREVSVLIRDILDRDHALLAQLEDIQVRAARELSDMQHGRAAVGAYRAER